MIARLWYGSTRREDGAEYVDYLERTGVTAHRSTPGNRGSLVLRRDSDGRSEFVVLSFWESTEAIGLFAGDDISRAVYFPDDDRFLVDRRNTIDHFEIVAGSADSVRPRDLE